MEPSLNNNNSMIANKNDLEGQDEEPVKSGWTTMTPQEISIWIDRRARFVFPCAFCVFNALFWTFVYCL